jgi:hypothetical protein
LSRAFLPAFSFDLTACMPEGAGDGGFFFFEAAYGRTG